MFLYQNKYRAESNKWQFWDYFINILGNYGFDNGVSVVVNNDGGDGDVDKIHEFYLRYNKKTPSENDIKQSFKLEG